MMMTWLEQGFGYDIILWFQSWRTEFISLIFKPFNYVGTKLFFIVLISIIYWVINKKEGRSISIFFLLTVWSNSLLKNWFKRPRPFNVTVQGKDPIIASFKGPSSYGLPSGHTMSTTSFFTLLFIRFRSITIRIFSILLILLVPLSRLIHGMHYLQDIILAYFLSFTFLVIFLLVEKKIANLIHRFHWKVFVPLILLTGLILFLLPLMTGIEKSHIKEPLVLSSFSFFGLIGYFVEYKWIGFCVPMTLLKKALAFLAGIVILIALKVGTSYAIKPLADMETLTICLKMVQAILISLWLTAGAPFLFVVTGLSQRELQREW